MAMINMATLQGK